MPALQTNAPDNEDRPRRPMAHTSHIHNTMTTEQTASQLRLAADILETGHPWEYSTDHFHWKLSTGKCPMFAIRSQWEIRLALATPPDSRPLHNPDNLTAEQVGAGWRLPLKVELDGRFARSNAMVWDEGSWFDNVKGDDASRTYRVPLSTPWPDPKTQVPLGPEDVPRADSAICSECNWTNTSLLNLGEPGKPRWICPGCCKRAFQKIDMFRSTLDAWEPCHKPG